FGRSGSGKSTLLNLISGIDVPSSGKIIFENQDITNLDEKGRTLFRRKNIGFIFQFFNLIPTLTVLENLILPVELVKLTTKHDTEAAMELLKKISLSDRADTYPDKLSGGEQQRVAIARALVHNPQLILADEPTGNLDYETGKSIVSLLDNLVRKQGKTMIMATHSREVIGLADYIIRVKDGSLSLENMVS
ncbi:MAG: ABC transporter ATP-binding protein, partial [Candidatus Kapaibacterium sp.]